MSFTQFDGSAAFSGGGFMPPQATHTGTDTSFSSTRNRDIQTLLPLTVKQITDACVSAVDKSEFVIDSVDVNNVTLVGMVHEKIGRITDVAFFLDDGTGRMECNKWFHEAKDANEMERILDGMYVRIHGRLKSFQGKKTLNVFSIRPVSDYNEIASHFIECIYVHLYNSRLRKPPADFGVAAQPHMTFPTNQLSGQYSFDGQSSIEVKVLEILSHPSYLGREEGAHLEDIARQLKIPVNDLMSLSLSLSLYLYLSLTDTHAHMHAHNYLHTKPISESYILWPSTATIAGHHHQGASPTSATDLSIFSSGITGPKLEDFLGGCTPATNTVTPTSLPRFSTADHHHQTTPLALSQNEIYDSELKTIAASFLRGFSTTATTTAANLQTTKLQNHHPLASSDPTPKKPADTFGQRTSIYRGVTRHRWTGRYEAHLWDNSCRREGQSRKGRQGGYDKEEKAARAYDLAALKYWGPTTTTNFPVINYEKELSEMKNMTRQEFVASLRRKSSGFSRGASIYRGVTRHHQHGRWQARIGRVAGNKDLYLGTFSTQEEAAEAYDIAAIKFRGLNAVTNFDMSRYDVKSIASSNLPIGGMSGKSKNSSDSDSKSIEGNRSADDRDLSSASSVTFASQQPSSSTLSFAIPLKQDPSSDYWSNIFGYNPSQNNTKNPTTVSVAPSSSLFQSRAIGSYGNNSSPMPFNVDFSSTFSTSASETNNGYFGNFNIDGQRHQEQLQHHQHEQSTITGTGSIPFATPIALNGNNGYETSSGYGSWIAPSIHTFQTHAKTNLFQTPIFGME
ncbi:AP2-like ethylene-responsive transcription factor AIL5 [Pyrus ussuriensis x Pyrus communis]|uniref:AP2-like ethylene-responsive transcription factor AIL5 n=1 Tax=Pyrus ussuriensis x Pyrus communis TaxID=2448454 RepID=A0A5N5FAP1_9ROSA|nr:AP2-like ethylene-responsive transcription factor AIL5 [Pyrus ussuriensis x Pyrus communis]